MDIPQKDFHIYKFNFIDSTMSLCENFPKSLISSSDIFIFISDQQSQNIGQRDSKWFSPPGNIYLTILQKLDPGNIQYMALVAVKSVFNALGEYFVENGVVSKSLNIRWVNDVYLEENKVAGVMVQT
jgi:BirA family transcriptional regulator, biotin operon repressor / biotin---[acetyl-CoA-carboxylase] ligase